jgi:hypothetical protein
MRTRHPSTPTAASPNCAPRSRRIYSIRQHTPAYVSIRQHTSAYVSIRQHTSAYVSKRGVAELRAAAARSRRSRQPTDVAYVSIRQHTSAYVSIRQHTYVSIRQHTSAYVSIRQHTSAYFSIRQHTSAYRAGDLEGGASASLACCRTRQGGEGVHAQAHL